jgi:hydrocephalus-inducing protein
VGSIPCRLVLFFTQLQEEVIVVEKAVVLVQVDTTQLAVPQVAAAVLADPLMPAPADIIRALNSDSTALSTPVTLSVLHRPKPRDSLVVSPAFVLVDKELQKQQQEALAALQSQADVPVEDEKGKGKTRRVDSRQSSREPKGAAATNPSLSMKKAKPKASRRHGDLLEDETLTETDEKPVIDLDDTLRQPRWVIPAGGEARVCVRFMTLDIGCIDQPLTFETVGSQRRYTVFVRGLCEYATVNRAPKALFGSVHAEKPADKIGFRGYISSTNTLDFGPVLCGKSREGFKSDRFEANVMRVNLVNPGASEISVQAVFENDTGFHTFTLEPPSCVIGPGASQVLRVWAYPKNTNNYHDKVLVCIKDNPAPLVFGVTVEGAEPAVELDRKLLSFERVLLHRKDTRTLQLRNKSKLPIAWVLSGMEQLGEDFSASSLGGTLDPLQEHVVTFTFRATRPMIVKKVTVRVCVCVCVCVCVWSK